MNQRLFPYLTAMAMALALAFLSASASADIAPPEPPRPTRPAPPRPGEGKAVDLPLTIKLHDDSKPMKLELPEKLLAVKAAADVEGDGATTAGVGRTVVAAVLLSFGAMAGGLWLARKRGRGAGIAAAAMVIGAAGLWVSDAWANRAPPPPQPPVLPLPAAGPSIRIESSANGKTAVLHISEAQLAAIAKELAAQKKGGAEGRGDGAGSPPRSAPPPTQPNPAP
ncbi:MAG: hypothetical protein WD768_12420 [Phycisphaeraceae bacterium]